MIKIIITGATGMVGEGVLHVSLSHPSIEKVLVINRKPCGVVHSKLKEIIELCPNFPDSLPEKIFEIFEPLIKTSVELQDHIILILRKAIFSREVHMRSVGVYGFLSILKTEKKRIKLCSR